MMIMGFPYSIIIFPMIYDDLLGKPLSRTPSGDNSALHPPSNDVTGDPDSSSLSGDPKKCTQQMDISCGLTWQ